MAWKLVWVPPTFEEFVLVDDDGELLASGKPTGRLPRISEREQNFRITGNGKYSKEAAKRGAAKAA